MSVKNDKIDTIYVQYIFFGSDRGLNPDPCVFYALSKSTELSSRGHMSNTFIHISILTCMFAFVDKNNKTCKILFDYI